METVVDEIHNGSEAGEEEICGRPEETDRGWTRSGAWAAGNEAARTSLGRARAGRPIDANARPAGGERRGPEVNDRKPVRGNKAETTLRWRNCATAAIRKAAGRC